MNFYVLKTSIGESSAEMEFYATDDSVLGEAPRCPTCNKFIGMLKWKPPFRVEIKFWGTKYGDISFGPGELLLSERLVKSYMSENLKGIRILGPAEVVKVVPKRMLKGLPKYYIGEVRRSNAIFDDIASGAVWETPWTCETCRQGILFKRTKRVVIKEETWEGDDLFYARGLPGSIITSERFKEFVDKHQILGAKLVKASKYSFDFYPKWYKW